jgi:hypothetical protein
MGNNESDKELRELRLEAVLAEYNDLRDEIKRRIDQRTHISYFMVAIILVALGLYVTSDNALILVFIPSVLIYWLFIIDSSYSAHLSIIGYIREKIEAKKLPLLIGKVDDEEGWIYWETDYFKTKKKRYSQRFRVYIIFSWLIYILCGAMIYKTVSIFLFLLYWVIYGVFIVYLSHKCREYYKTYTPYG